MTDEELFSGLPGVPTLPAPPSNGAKTPGKNPASLKAVGIGRGGVIRNATTKRRQQLNNPLTNPKPPRTGTIRDSTPEQELKAANPALAFPSIMTGMDLDINKGAGTAQEVSVSEPSANIKPEAASVVYPPPEAEEVPMTSTLIDLLTVAALRGGMWHTGKHNEWLVSVQIRSIDLINYLVSKSRA